MQKIRWYDKNQQLSALFSFIEAQDENTQQDIAKILLQLLINEFDINLDQEISKMSLQQDYDYKRWYDSNIDLFSITELTKSLSFEQQVLFAQKATAELFLDSLKKDSQNG